MIVQNKISEYMCTWLAAMYEHVNIGRKIPTGSNREVGGWGGHALQAADAAPFFSTPANVAHNLKSQSYQGIPGLTYRSSSPTTVSRELSCTFSTTVDYVPWVRHMRHR